MENAKVCILKQNSNGNCRMPRPSCHQMNIVKELKGTEWTHTQQ